MSDGQTLTVPGAPVSTTGTAASSDATTQGSTGGTGAPAPPPANGGPPAPTPPPTNEGARGSARTDPAPQTPTPTPPPPAPTPPTPPADPGAETPEPAGKVEDLPAWAQQEVRHARKGEGDQRVRANALEAQFTEFKTKQEKLLEGVAKLFGLVGDDEQQPAPDPATLTAELSQVQQRYRDRTIDLSVYRAAAEHGGDPGALLDSREFIDRIRTLDPDAEDFGAKVGEAIKAAVAGNPKFRAAALVAPPAAPSGGTFGGGPSSTVSSDAKTVEDFRRDRREQRKREP